MSDSTCDTVHCPECHEAPLLRKRLATAEAERAKVEIAHRIILQTNLADAAALRERVTRSEALLETATNLLATWMVENRTPSQLWNRTRAFLASVEPDGASGNRQGK